MNNLQIINSDIRTTAWNSLSENTKEAYQKDLLLFVRDFGEDINKANSKVILAYIKKLQKDGYKNSTINRKVSTLSKFFNMQIIAGKRNSNPVNELRNVSRINFNTTNRINEPLSEEELLYVIKNSKPKISLIIETLALNTALRISELLNIKYSDIKNYNKDYKIIHVRGKNNKEGDVYINNNLYNRILEVFPIIPETEYLFYTKFKDKYNRKVLWKLITDEFKRLIGRSIRPHFLRHKWATMQLERGRNIKEISKYLRHSNIATTSIYLDSVIKPEDSNINLGA